MSRLIAVKIGNTTASAALASDGALGDVLRVPVGRLENLKEILTCAASSGGARLAEEGAAVIVASVNPRALAHLRGIAVDATGAEPEVAGEDFPIPIRADVEEPERVGTDRLLAALAARGRLGSPCVVVDLGTAVTVDAVAADGAFAGGAIFPGLEMSADALARGTALLPKISLPTDAPRIGRSTAEAISAGLLHGAAGAIAALVSGARATVGKKAPVLLTGGDAEILAPHLPTDMRQVQPNLVLEGLVLAYQEWKGR